MYAVIETGGKQYRVTEGDVVFLERLNGEPGDIVNFEKILACSNESETEFGKPYLQETSVEAKILGHGKNKKIVIFKYKAKKGYRKKQGHRQPYSKVRIERIISGKYGIASAPEEEPETVEDLGADEVIGEVADVSADEPVIADDEENVMADDAVEDDDVEIADVEIADVEIIDDVADTIIDVDAEDVAVSEEPGNGDEEADEGDEEAGDGDEEE